MRKERTFSAFGVEYRTRQIAAVPAFDVLARRDDIHPCELFCLTDVKDESGQWVAMSDPKHINEYVEDVTGQLAPRLVLAAVMELVNDYNFGFLIGWKGVKVPTRFTSDVGSVNSDHTDPMIAQLIQDGAASMQQLEEYYSLEDAFRMFDIIVAKSVNAAKAQEASIKNSKKR